MADNIIKNKEYYSDFLKAYEEAKSASNKHFANIMEDIILKAGIHTKEELSNKC